MVYHSGLNKKEKRNKEFGKKYVRNYVT